MSDIVISVENIGKRYRLHHQGKGERYTALRDVIARQAVAPFRAVRDKMRGRSGLNGSHSNDSINPKSNESIEDFWALRDVSLEVKRGNVVGIIGGNGAGKSTLLKILSRITDPSEGRVRLRGRVASLLEVGTGFHPELTGRENISLNGAILGMTNAEVRQKFDEIVAFSEIEKFLDTPVKHYSSGMYMRLAFAVAAHLDPEILIVDEVLAVGDAEFQKKCLGRMKDVASGGRTVLFVSHNMAAISALCSRAACLERGRLVSDGSVSSVVKRYLDAVDSGTGRIAWQNLREAPGNERIRITDIEVRVDQTITSEVRTSDVVTISFGFRVLVSMVKISPYLLLLDQMGTEVLCAANLPSAIVEPDPIILSTFEPGQYRTECFLPADLLNERRYFVKAGFNSHLTHHEFGTDELISFLVLKTDAMRSEYQGDWPGLVRPRLRWRTTRFVPAE